MTYYLSRKSSKLKHVDTFTRADHGVPPQEVGKIGLHTDNLNQTAGVKYI